MSAALLRRLQAMDRAELRFRAATALRARVDRTRATLRPPAWDRTKLRLAPATSPSDARGALAHGDWHRAHLALANHFTSRPPRFLLDPSRLPAVAERIRTAFPMPSVRTANDLLAGRSDLLGYRGVTIGAPPDWHRDPVHDRTAPLVFWDSVPYLSPEVGDHKVIWEINRHQQFLALGRAHVLTNERRYYLEFVRQLSDWVAANPPLMGINWASMLELGFRCLSWVWALHFFANAASDADEQPWIVDLLLALDAQLRHIEQNLSRYFSPNTHLTGEALALYVTGRALHELDGARRREAMGRDVLLEEFQRQVLADGGHAERSPHYHRYSTDFYLLAFNVARVTGDPHAPDFRRAALAQARYLRAIADDRGRLPLIGDDDGGQLFPICRRAPADCSDTLATAAVLLDEPSLALGPLPEETFWSCGTVPGLETFRAEVTSPASIALVESGYYVSRTERGDHLIFDCGPQGYLNAGHAHADALSVVLTIAGRQLLVDSGTATYTMDPEARDRFRSTAMHNTVVVDGRSQAVPAGPFHWRTRADAVCTAWESGPNRDQATGRHDAYAPVVHERQITALHGEGWIVVDHLTGDGRAELAAMWHIHPDWRLEALEGTTALLRHRDGAGAVIHASEPLARVTDRALNEYAPEYGRIERGICLRCAVTNALPFSIVTVIPAEGGIEAARRLASSVQR